MTLDPLFSHGNRAPNAYGHTLDPKQERHSSSTTEQAPKSWTEVYEEFFSSPELTPPPIEHSLIDYQFAFEKQQPEIVEFFHQETESKFIQLQNFSKERAEKIREGAKLTQQKAGWGIFKTVTECFLSALSVALGFALMFGGSPVIGSLLVFIGVLEICNIVYAKTGMWDYFAKKMAHDNEDTQRKIKTILPAVISAVAMVAGSAGTYYAGKALPSSTVSQNTMGALMGLGNVSQGVASIGEGVCEGRMAWNEAEHDAIVTNESLANSLISQFNISIDTCFHSGKEAARLIAKCLKDSSNTKTRMLRDY